MPASRYRPSARAFPQRLPALEYGPDDQVRKVQQGGPDPLSQPGLESRQSLRRRSRWHTAFHHHRRRISGLLRAPSNQTTRPQDRPLIMTGFYATGTRPHDAPLGQRKNAGRRGAAASCGRGSKNLQFFAPTPSAPDRGVLGEKRFNIIMLLPNLNERSQCVHHVTEHPFTMCPVQTPGRGQGVGRQSLQDVRKVTGTEGQSRAEGMNTDGLHPQNGGQGRRYCVTCRGKSRGRPLPVCACGHVRKARANYFSTVSKCGRR